MEGHPYWCVVPRHMGKTVCQAMEDAHIRSYTTINQSSHDDLVEGKKQVVELVDFDTYWKYKALRWDELDETIASLELSVNQMLEYLATE